MDTDDKYAVGFVLVGAVFLITGLGIQFGGGIALAVLGLLMILLALKS